MTLKLSTPFASVTKNSAGMVAPLTTPKNVPIPPYTPMWRLSSRMVSAPAWLGWMTEAANSPTKPTPPPSVGCAGPLNLPVAGSSDGGPVMMVSIATPRPMTWLTRLLATCWFEAAAHRRHGLRGPRGLEAGIARDQRVHVERDDRVEVAQAVADAPVDEEERHAVVDQVRGDALGEAALRDIGERGVDGERKDLRLAVGQEHAVGRLDLRDRTDQVDVHRADVRGARQRSGEHHGAIDGHTELRRALGRRIDQRAEVGEDALAVGRSARSRTARPSAARSGCPPGRDTPGSPRRPVRGSSDRRARWGCR